LPSPEGAVEDLSEREIVEVLARIEALIDSEDAPPGARRIARAGLERLRDIQKAMAAHDPDQAIAIQKSLTNLIPPGLRGVDTVLALSEYIDVDQESTPPSVTVHWERVPRKHRATTASLASAYVDFFQPPPKGGRPKKSQGNTS
jgi:hypothetical protein